MLKTEMLKCGVDAGYRGGDWVDETIYEFNHGAGTIAVWFLDEDNLETIRVVCVSTRHISL
jgi:hypothetical protein